MKTYQILILEDDLTTLSALLGELAKLEEKMLGAGAGDLAVTVYSTHEDVEEFVNATDKRFDIILLDRDCKLAGSFHVIAQNKLDEAEVVSISSVPEWNRQAKERGVQRVILKEFADSQGFAGRVRAEVEQIINQAGV